MLSSIKKQIPFAKPYFIKMGVSLAILYVIATALYFFLSNSIMDGKDSIAFGAGFCTSLGVSVFLIFSFLFMVSSFHLSVGCGSTRKECLLGTLGCNTLSLSILGFGFAGLLLVTAFIASFLGAVPNISFTIAEYGWGILIILAAIVVIQMLSLVFAVCVLYFGAMRTLVGFYTIYLLVFMVSMLTSTGSHIAVPTSLAEKVIKFLSLFVLSIPTSITIALAVLVGCGILGISFYAYLRCPVR